MQHAIFEIKILYGKMLSRVLNESVRNFIARSRCIYFSRLIQIYGNFVPRSAPSLSRGNNNDDDCYGATHRAGN